MDYMDYKKKYMKYKIKYNNIKKLFGGSTVYNENPPDFPKKYAKPLRHIIYKQNREIEKCNKELSRLREIGRVNFYINSDILFNTGILIKLIEGMSKQKQIMDNQNAKVLIDILENIRSLIK